MQIGLMCGALFVWMADWYGRKKHMFFGCIGICAGTVINALSTSVPMFIGSRFVMSFFVAWATIAAPIYLVEIAPAAYRGTVAGLYNTFYYVVSRLYVMTDSIFLAPYVDYKYISPLNGD
jgi:MFS family permease